MHWVRRGLVIATLTVFFHAATTYGEGITVNPRAIGAPEQSFTASFIGLNYLSGLTQSATTGAFTENGGGTFTNFYQSDQTTVVGGTGLNKHYTLSASFTGAGSAVPTAQGFSATFDSFNLRMYAGQTLVGYSTGLISGTASIVPDSLIHATGHFDVTVGFTAVGGFFSSAIQTAHLQGPNDSYTIGTGSTFYSVHTGSGYVDFGTGLSQSLTLTALTDSGSTPFITNPEPSALLLLGSGLAGFAIMRFRKRRH